MKLMCQFVDLRLLVDEDIIKFLRVTSAFNQNISKFRSLLRSGTVGHTACSNLKLLQLWSGNCGEV